MPGHLVAVLAAAALSAAGCTQPAPNPELVPAATNHTGPTVEPPKPAQPRLASDPAQLARELVAEERTLRNPATDEAALVDAARRQQASYRAISRNAQWDSIIGPLIPESLRLVYGRNVDALRNLATLTDPVDMLPAWRVVVPPPAAELLGYYREAAAASGVPWNYLAAINLIETRLGSIQGLSTSGAQGPMQFMPDTWAEYGLGDINSSRDAILAAGRFLAANGFTQGPLRNRDRAIFRYNNSRTYVHAVTDYATILAADPATFGHYWRWEVYFATTAGDVLLPIGYSATSPIPVDEYLASHPQ